MVVVLLLLELLAGTDWVVRSRSEILPMYRGRIMQNAYIQGQNPKEGDG